MLVNISAPLAETDSDEAGPSCPVRKLFYFLFFAFPKIIGKHLCGSLLLINLQVFSLKETPARKFSCRFIQILKEHVYLKNHSGWLLLLIQYRLIAIKIQVVFKLSWILKLNSQKSVFSVCYFSLSFFLLYLYHLLIRERLVCYYMDISKSFFKNCVVFYFLNVYWRESLWI